MSLPCGLQSLMWCKMSIPDLLLSADIVPDANRLVHVNLSVSTRNNAGNSMSTDYMHAGLFLKIAILNLCLGLKFKKELVKNLLQTHDIDILLMQETELEADFDCELLNIPGYNLECECNNTVVYLCIFFYSMLCIFALPG